MERDKIIDELIKIEDFPQCIPDKSWEDLLDTVEELCQDEAILTEARFNAAYPTKKAKEIALEGAIRNKPTYMPLTNQSLNQNTLAGLPVYDIVKEAEKIYQWLIKE